MTIAAEIFREYDIRGVVGVDLSTDVALKIGQAVGTYVRRGGGRQVVVGRDCRLSGKELTRAFTEGVCRTGCQIIDIGEVPTPVQYWAIQHLDADGGVQITGSHNPPEYNGFKLTLLGRSLHGPDIQKIRKWIAESDFETGDGSSREEAVLEPYLQDLQRLLRPMDRRLKVVVDAGNGMGGITGVPLYEALGCDVIPLYCDPDGNFPNHHPDPTVEENLEELRAAVSEHDADLGIAFDGDGDRLGVIDRDGEVVWGDRLTVLLARAVLDEEPGAVIIGEVKCSKTLYDDIALHGGRPVMWRAGHSLIKAKMKEEKAALAGEMSGHIFFQHRYYGFDDAAYAGGRLLEILGGSESSIGELLADVPVMVATPEIRMDCPESLKFDLVARVTEAFKTRAAKTGDFRVVDIDGARVEWDDGWGLVRCSNTQPILVLRFEAIRSERLEEIRQILTDEIANQRKILSAD